MHSGVQRKVSSVIKDFTGEFLRAVRVETRDNDPLTYIIYGGHSVLKLPKAELGVLAHLLIHGGETSFGFVEVRVTFKYGVTKIRLDPFNGPPIEIRIPTEGGAYSSSVMLAQHLIELASPKVV